MPLRLDVLEREGNFAHFIIVDDETGAKLREDTRDITPEIEEAKRTRTRLEKVLARTEGAKLADAQASPEMPERDATEFVYKVVIFAYFFYFFYELFSQNFCFFFVFQIF